MLSVRRCNRSLIRAGNSASGALALFRTLAPMALFRTLAPMALFRALGAVALFFTWVSVATAATADEQPEVVRMDFSALSLGEYLPEVYYESMGQVQRLAVNNGSRSAPRTYVGDPTLVFFTEHTAADGARKRETLGSVDLRGRKGPLLLLFEKATAPETPATSAAAHRAAAIRIAALEDGAEIFPNGSYRLLNMTGQQIRASLGGEIVSVAPYSAGIAVTPSSGRGEGRGMAAFNVVMGRFDAQREGWTRFYESRWPQAHSRRTLVLLYPREKNSDEIGVRRIVQMVELPAELLPHAAVLSVR